ncbi:alkaline phosphatase family protein [Leptolyngbya sp. FACHB-261]|uniref:alkaline phosphatase family protein n=1 Tax=Leptolyngbya sp. FACHB-261 TaxID=2692806 RepID=UPI001687633C|nr:alkaline phosphatase family protein [Leptolyngbya sp. FACHB-261]MBD2103816.1 alkaline phosphatase family protein [Leptolyngbya sp. FACHB-261]
MTSPVVAIGLDGADALLIETWMSQGYLPNLARLRESGVYGRLANVPYNTTETTWPTVWSGCLPHTTGYWSPARLREGSYEIEDVGAYNFAAHPPFYALGPNYRVAAFDLPQTVFSEQVHGPQVLGWGGHAPYTPRRSAPKPLLSELERQYGKHPARGQDYGDWWRTEYLSQLKENLKVGAARRTTICRSLLQQERWDLLVTVFSETHSAGHDFWHLSQPDHPLHEQKLRDSQDSMLEVFQAVDQGVGELLADLPEETSVVAFSGVGMGSNATDVPSMLFMAEFLYRFSFPGQSMLTSLKLGQSLPAVKTPKWRTWSGEVWQQTHEPNLLKKFLRYWLPGKYQSYLEHDFSPQAENRLASPYQLRQQGNSLFWQPTLWYSPLWSRMKAFALPSFSEGYVRINLQGREPQGIVPQADYDSICEQLTGQIYQLRDGRTGEPMVREVIRVRQFPTDSEPGLIPADLVVVWHEHPTDVIDSPEYGRIGPATYFRPGGHRDRGFVFARGPKIAAGSSLKQGHVVDLGPTILQLMGVPLPQHYDGRPLFVEASPVSL